MPGIFYGNPQHADYFEDEPTPIRKQEAMTTDNERWWDTNEFGHWCPSCGHCLSNDPEEEISREECPTCGFPEDIEKTAEYFAGGP